MHWLRQFALCYSAGTAGGLAKGGFIWLCERAAVTAAFADQLALGLRPGGLYTRMVWSGLFAWIFLLPFARGSVLLRGLLAALAISVLQLIVLPLLQHAGLHLLSFATLSLLLLNCVWGLVSAGLLRLTE